MTAMSATGRPRNLILAGMIFAVAMTFIDQTIVSIAAPNIQRELGLTDTGMQWAINAYLLALAALFAFGGRLADTLGHRKMVVLGVIIFAAASAMCGLTPKGSGAEAWLIIFRAVQGAGGAIMFPAALGIVVQTFPLRERGKALATFFGITGALTAIGPLLGGYLTEWTWRAIFWVNIPVAVVALILIAIAKPTTDYKPAPIDYRGLALIVGGVALSVIGFQQSATWGWGNAATILCIVVGVLLLVAFVRFEQRTRTPLMKVDIFRIRAFAMENLVLGIAMLAFVPLFFFASEYAQIALGKSAQTTGLVLLYFFLGFVVTSQIGGRILDARGAKIPVVLGCAIAAVGFALWAGKMTDLNLSHQVWWIILAGAGMGFMLSPASTDAVNRASRLSYGEATGITQTVRNYAASLGLAILGTILVNRLRSEVTGSLIAHGTSPAQAAAGAAKAAAASSGASGGGGGAGSVPGFFRLDFAHASQTVFYVMAGVMAVAAVVALIGLQPGVQPDLATATVTATASPTTGPADAVETPRAPEPS
ncbi:MAG TPA: MFS transporter [Acidimicrobiales bacterium]|nr:MFS transporter [Acidimicrobiales bacterium]